MDDNNLINDEHEYEEDFEMMHLELDDGEEIDCFVLGIFEVEEKEYIALLPENDEDILLYAYTELEDGAQLDNIESDEEYEKVAKVFDEILEEEYGDEDHDCGCGSDCGCDH